MDGRRLTPVVAEADGGVEVELPVPAGPPRHRYELVYEEATPAWSLWTRLEVAAPVPAVLSGGRGDGVTAGSRWRLMLEQDHDEQRLRQTAWIVLAQALGPQIGLGGAGDHGRVRE